jgi:Ca2+-binding EF-hand superfamily protein
MNKLELMNTRDFFAEDNKAMKLSHEHLLNSYKVKDVFEKYDTDKSGYLDKKEMKELFKNLNRQLERFYSDHEQERIFKNLDKNGDGRISLEEFKRFYI